MAGPPGGHGWVGSASPSSPGQPLSLPSGIAVTARNLLAPFHFDAAVGLELGDGCSGAMDPLLTSGHTVLLPHMNTCCWEVLKVLTDPPGKMASLLFLSVNAL